MILTGCMLVALLLGAGHAGATAEPVTVGMRIDTFERHPISRYVYGLNFPEAESVWGRNVPRGVTLARMGGNRLSAYNWETNASNCGNDCGDLYANDGFLGGGDKPGEAVRKRAIWAREHGAAFLATVPMLGWVSADKAGAVPLTIPVSERRASRFLVSKARKGAPPSSTPDRSDRVVYQDEFVAWLDRQFPGSRTDPETPIFWSLDNEPDLWGSTHEEVRGNRLRKDRYVLTGYDELVRLSVEYASAIKDLLPDAQVFGPALSNWNGFTNLYHNDAPDPAGRTFFLEYYLDAMRKEGERQGRRLLDVLDVHWYPEIASTNHQSITNEWAPQDSAMIQARVQAPRSLWDPTFRERSWVDRVTGGPVRLLPRLKELVARHHPGTKIAITEYSYFRGGDISGAIAQADALGIFGREGVYAATLWPQGAIWAYKGDADRTYACTFAAFRAYRDYDGKGAAFGDLSLPATTSDQERTSIHASTDSSGSGRIVLVAINKSEQPVDAAVSIASALAWGRAEVWLLTGGVGTCTGPERVSGELPLERNAFTLRLPPLSVATVVVRR